MSRNRLALKDTPIGTKSRMGKVVDHLLKDGFEFALNSELKPIIVNPEVGFQTAYLIDSQEFEDLITCVWFELFNNDLLQAGDLKFLLCVFREECRRGGKYLTEIEVNDIEQNPIVQTVLELMNIMPVFNQSTARLLFELRCIAKKLKNYSEDEMPAFTGIFSRQLRRLVGVLAEYGVDVDFKHTEKGSFTILRRNDKFRLEAEYPPATVGPVSNTDDKIIFLASVPSPGESTTSVTAEGTDVKTSDANAEEVDLISALAELDSEEDSNAEAAESSSDETDLQEEESDEHKC